MTKYGIDILKNSRVATWREDDDYVRIVANRQFKRIDVDFEDKEDGLYCTLTLSPFTTLQLIEQLVTSLRFVEEPDD